jgi:uncharacterized protein
MAMPALAPPPCGPAGRGRGRGLFAFVAALFAFLALAGAALADPTFPPLSGRVVDAAHLLSPQTAQKLDAELARLEQQTGHQLVVATVPDLQGYEIEDYGYRLGRAWALGRKGQNDGAVLLVAPKERKVRIEVGYGLEPVLTDALSSIILQRQVLPAFKAGQMEQGVVAGTEALIQQLALPEDQAKAQVVQAAQARQAQASRDPPPPIPVLLAVVIVFFILAGLFSRGRRYGGGGGGLWWLLPLILSSGRRDGGGWGGGGGGGGFSGGGGSFGGGGSSGSW